MELKWSTEPPTEEGWYWVRFPRGQLSPTMPHYYDARQLDVRTLSKLKRAGYKWAGPIPAPQEET